MFTHSSCLSLDMYIWEEKDLSQNLNDHAWPDLYFWDSR